MTHSSRETGPHLNVTRARQGRWGRHVFWVLVFGTLLAGLGMMFAWAWQAETYRGPMGHATELNSGRAYDQAQTIGRARRPSPRTGQTQRNIAQEIHLRLEEFLRGVALTVRVNDPAHPGGPELYPLTIPPDTAPGARFRVARAGPFPGGMVTVKVKARPDFRFKVRGSDLCCDLRIGNQRAAQGGAESVRGVSGNQ